MADIAQDFHSNPFYIGRTKAPPDHPLWRTQFAKQQGRPLRRRPDHNSFPFSSTDHPFSTSQADLLFSLLTTLDGLVFPEQWESTFPQGPPETTWRQKDDSTQGLLQDASSGIIDFMRFLARESNSPFRDNTTAAHGLIAITTLVRYLNGDT